MKRKARLYFDVTYDDTKTDPDSVASAMDTLIETAMSTPDVLDEYGNPEVGEVLVDANWRSDITLEMLKAASDAMGFDVDEERVELAMERQDSFDADQLAKAEAAFARAGGRGVELAEEIDDLRILKAVESAR